MRRCENEKLPTANRHPSTVNQNKVAKKNIPDKNGFVFSTDPDFVFQNSGSSSSDTLPPAKQRLRIVLDTHHRGGKAVTAIIGFVGKTEDLEILGKKLKQYCSTGGSVKDGQILIQGDQTLKVRTYLLKEGYKA
jgi:translation initiation factor 1